LYEKEKRRLMSRRNKKERKGERQNKLQKEKERRKVKCTKLCK
jgi:hypothetical protein